MKITEWATFFIGKLEEILNNAATHLATADADWRHVAGITIGAGLRMLRRSGVTKKDALAACETIWDKDQPS
jgi:hypothetical protein